MLSGKQVSVRNRLLAALPREDYQNLLPFLEPVKLAYEEILYEPHTRIRHVYFPNDCFVSMLTTVDGGRAAEVGLVGSEGMIGLPVALGAAVSPFRAVVQGGGTATRMKVADFRRDFSKSNALRRAIALFVVRLTYVTMGANLTYMEKTQVYLRKEELAALREAAARSGRSVAELVRDAVRKTVLRPQAAGPVAIWDGEPRRRSVDHDSVHDEP